MTLEELRIAALARAVDYGIKAPVGRSPAYRRVSVRQAQLFSRASKLNPDWAGVQATVPLVAWASSLAVDLADLVDPAEPAELITRVEIADKGGSNYVNGQEVNLVKLVDANVADPPRATVRNLVVQGVGNDFLNVTSLRVFYSRVPATMDDPGCSPEIPTPHDELLVIDLTKWITKKTISIDSGTKTAIIATLDAEEKEALDIFDEYIMRFSDATVSRFGGSRYASGRAS